MDQALEHRPAQTATARQVLRASVGLIARTKDTCPHSEHCLGVTACTPVHKHAFDQFEPWPGLCTRMLDNRWIQGKRAGVDDSLVARHSPSAACCRE
jgi:hypothetical protein